MPIKVNKYKRKDGTPVTEYERSNPHGDPKVNKDNYTPKEQKSGSDSKPINYKDMIPQKKLIFEDKANHNYVKVFENGDNYMVVRGNPMNETGTPMNDKSEALRFAKQWIANAKEKNQKKYAVWIGGSVVNDYLLTKEEAERLKKQYEDDGYDDVVIEEVLTKGM